MAAAVKKVPAGCGQCGRHEARQWPDTIATTGYGDDLPPPRAPVVVPCSTVVRWFLAARRFLLG